jgi:hypothetical protein
VSVCADAEEREDEVRDGDVMMCRPSVAGMTRLNYVISHFGSTDRVVISARSGNRHQKSASVQ